MCMYMNACTCQELSFKKMIVALLLTVTKLRYYRTGVKMRPVILAKKISCFAFCAC